MRWSLVGWCTLALLALPAALPAQDEATLRKNHAEKLEKPFAKKIEWELSLEKAKERARAEGKPILGYFTRSFSP